MAEQRLAESRPSSQAPYCFQNNIHRQLNLRAGWLSRGPTSRHFGDLVSRREISSYKLPRDESRSQHNQSLCGGAKKRGSHGSDGQLDCSQLRKQRGRNPLSLPRGGIHKNLRNYDGTERSFEGKTHRQVTQSISRHTVTRRKRSAHGMESQRECLQSPVKRVWTARSRSIRDSIEPEDRRIFLTSSRFSCDRRRCPCPRLVEQTQLCLPSICPDPKGSGEGSKVCELPNNANCSAMASPSLVHESSQPASRLAYTPRRLVRSPPAGSTSPPSTKESKFTRLEDIERGLEKRGFSKESARAIARSSDDLPLNCSMENGKCS